MRQENLLPICFFEGQNLFISTKKLRLFNTNSTLTLFLNLFTINKLKVYLLLLLEVVLSNQDVFAQRDRTTYFYDVQFLNNNRISLAQNNYGASLDRNYICSITHDSIGGIVFDNGPFFISKIQDEIFESHVLWESLYSPGPIINNEPAMAAIPADSLRFRVYKINYGDSLNTDSLSRRWPKDLGAPYSENEKPLIYADQTLWTTCNAFDSNCIVPNHSTRRSGYPVFPLEVQQTVYSYQSGFNDSTNFLNETVFIEWLFINKGESLFDSVTIGLSTDIDFIGKNNFPAIDTVNQLAYCWTDWDTTYSWYDQTKLPAVGFVMLYGPIVPETGSTAIFKGEEKTGFKNLPLSAFWGFHDDSYPDTSNLSPAYSRETAWNISRGLDKNGNLIIDPSTNQPTKFRYAGDPINNTGWLSTSRNTSGGAGFYMFSGPVTMAPQDTQWVMFALTAAQGGDNMKSITELRRRANVLRRFEYSTLVKQTEIEVYDPNSPLPLPSTFALYQNYPNPFNPSTTIRYSIPFTSDVRFKIYNILGSEVWSDFEANKTPGTYELKWNGKNNSGTEIGSGVYVLKVETGSLSKSVKLMMIK